MEMLVAFIMITAKAQQSLSITTVIIFIIIIG